MVWVLFCLGVFVGFLVLFGLGFVGFFCLFVLVWWFVFWFFLGEEFCFVVVLFWGGLGFCFCYGLQLLLIIFKELSLIVSVFNMS